MKNKLRVGILLDSNDIPAWSYQMLKEIKESSYAEIVLVVKNNPKKENKISFFTKIWKSYNKIAYSLYRKIDRKLFKCTPDAFELKNINTLISVNEIAVIPEKTKFSDRITDDDLQQINRHNIDIFIRMGFRILRGNLLKIAKYGVWSYHHADNAVNRGGPAGFWEVIEGAEETGVVLQILNEHLDGGTILFKSYSLTDNISVHRNLNNFYWKALSFLPSKINELYTIGGEEFFKKVDEFNNHPQFYSNRLYTAPANKTVILYVLKKIISKTTDKINKLFFFNQWILLFKMNTSGTISTSFYQFKKIIPPKDRFWADPHILKKNDTYYIFIEEFIRSENKGFISVIEMDNKGNYKAPVKVLERDYHLSYPFLIEDKGEIFMLPETKANNTIELYKCVEFPLKWELETILINNIQAVDSTITCQDNKYWLFTNMVRNKGASANDELFLFSSDRLISNNWKNHPQNPVISDIKQSRPAGKFFVYKNALYRPSQNSSKHYGYGIKINKVEKLTETEYKETVIDSIVPGWEKKILSTHTINSVDKLTIIDALMKRRR